MRIEGQLEQFDVVLDQAGVFEFAQLPGVSEPGGDVSLYFRFEFRIIQASLEVFATLFGQRMQPVQLIERGAVNTLAFSGFQEWGPADVDTSSGSFTTSLRVAPRLHLDAGLHLQQRSTTSETVAGAGFLWRMTRASHLGFHAFGGSDNTLLPTSDVYADVITYVGPYEWGGGVRRLSFPGVDVAALSPIFAWDRGPTRLDLRYTFSRLHFDQQFSHVRSGRAAADDSTGDHSIMLRETWRGWRRASLNVGYAYGIESFEDLTADRIGSLGATTLSLGGRLDLPSLTMIVATYEHQWRSNSTAMDRLTLALVQFFP